MKINFANLQYQYQLYKTERDNSNYSMGEEVFTTPFPFILKEM
jgi:hypothetical protein